MRFKTLQQTNVVNKGEMIFSLDRLNIEVYCVYLFKMHQSNPVLAGLINENNYLVRWNLIMLEAANLEITFSHFSNNEGVVY